MLNVMKELEQLLVTPIFYVLMGVPIALLWMFCGWQKAVEKDLEKEFGKETLIKMKRWGA